MVANTPIVEPQTTLHAGCGKAGEVEVYSTTGTVWIVWKRQSIHFCKQITPLFYSGDSMEGYGGVQGRSGGAPGHAWHSLLGGGGAAQAGYISGHIL